VRKEEVKEVVKEVGKEMGKKLGQETLKVMEHFRGRSS